MSSDNKGEVANAFYRASWRASNWSFREPAGGLCRAEPIETDRPDVAEMLHPEAAKFECRIANEMIAR